MLNKGLQNELVQDFYRVVVNGQGQVTFNPAKVVNVSLVVTEGNTPSVLVCINNSDKRLPNKTQVLIKESDKYLSGYVVGSLKILKKYLKELKGAFAQDKNYVITFAKTENGFEEIGL